MERDPRTLAMPSVRPGTIDRDYRASFLPRLLPPFTRHFTLCTGYYHLVTPRSSHRGELGGSSQSLEKKKSIDLSRTRSRLLSTHCCRGMGIDSIVAGSTEVQPIEDDRRACTDRVDREIAIKSGGDTCGFVGHAQGTRSPIDIHLVLSPSTTPCCCCYSYGIRTTPNPRWTTLAMIEEEGRGATS